MRNFLASWDYLEVCHPWGVNVFAPLMGRFGVSPTMCEELDNRLFLDLVSRGDNNTQAPLDWPQAQPVKKNIQLIRLRLLREYIKHSTVDLRDECL